MTTYRIIYCHDDPKQPWYMLYADDIRRAFIAGVVLADNDLTPYEAIVESPDGWLLIRTDNDSNHIVLELVDDDKAKLIAAMMEDGRIIDHPLNGYNLVT